MTEHLINKKPNIDYSGKVAIVIAGQNSRHFLGEAIESALSQSVPCEVVYSDDCSTDDSLSVALTFVPRGLRIISNGIHSGVCAARNKGALATTAPYIIFLDTDDRLNKDYAKTMLEDIENDPTTPFVYPSTKCFGSSDTFWKNLEWSKYDRWAGNQVSTTSCWRRSVFLGAGMWQDLPSMWDYDLALRCSRFGTPYAGRAVLDYRIHENSQSAILDERLAIMAVPYKEQIRRKNATLGIGCLVSGRPEIVPLFPKWMLSLSRSVKYSMSSELGHPFSSGSKPKLFLLLHTKAQEHLNFYVECASKFSDSFSSIEFGIINDPVDRSTEFQRRNTVCRLLAKACNIIQDSLNTDLVWLIEDDIVVPMRAMLSLFTKVTSGNDLPIAISGTYYNRHLPEQLLGGWIMNGKHCEPTMHFRDTDVVDFIGTGCLMYWRDRPGTPKQWTPLTVKNEPGATAHDWAWSEAVEGMILMDGTVDCQHHSTVDEYV